MKVALVFMAVIAVTIAADTYINKWDNIDIDKILNTDRLFNSYVRCLMDKGQCTGDGRELKKLLPEALENECAKCTPTQKEKGEKVITHLIKNKKEIWDELKTKYDPTGEFTKKYQEQARAKGIEI